MKKSLIIILIIFAIILAIIGYYVYNTRRIASLSKQINETYEAYGSAEIEATSLISIINKAIDDNEKNGVEKVENGILYEDNGKNSIIITVKFLQSDNIYRMEDIARGTSESFINAYLGANFKCTSIEYHEQTNQIKSMQFEEVAQM